MLHDVRFAARLIHRNPGFALAAVLTLGLGLGANMAIFRFVDAVLLESLPVPDPEQLVVVRPWNFSYPAYREFSSTNSDVLTDTAGVSTAYVNVTVNGATEYLPAELVSGTYFATLRVKPATGRLLDPQDDGAEGAHPVCVISYDFWQRRFGGDAAVLGRSVELDSKPFEIVGVTQPGFAGADVHRRYDLQIPMSMTRHFFDMERDSTAWTWLTIIGRLRSGVPHTQAEAAVRTRFKPIYDAQKKRPLSLEPGRQGAGGLSAQLKHPVLIAQLLSGCVLLIACANLASLLLAKTSARRHEMAVRRSLGASRARLILQLVVESLMLACAGAVAGAGLAVVLARVLASMLAEPGSNQILTAIPSALDVAVAFGLVLLAAVGIGLLPALAATGDAPVDGLRDVPRAGARSGWAGRGLVVAQVVVCLVLLFTATLLARSLRNLRGIDLGLDPHRIVVLTTNPERSGYSKAQTREFYDEWLRRARRVPGVASASLATITALSGRMFAGVVDVPDAENRGGPELNNNFNIVTPDYFRTIGLPIVAGRSFTERDDAAAPRVVMVNERFVEYYWPGRNPIGRRITVFRRDAEIIGLVRTAKYRTVRESPEITIYFPAAQRPLGELTLHARVLGNIATTTTALIETVRAIDPRVPVYDVGMLEDHVNARIANERVLNVLSVLFAGVALAVACAGLYGLVASGVVRRTREVGIRLAVGAQRRDILRLFAAEIMALIGVGIAIGMPLSVAVGKQFSSVLYGIGPSSVSTLILASATLAVVVAVALPALRASALNPLTALRVE